MSNHIIFTLFTLFSHYFHIIHIFSHYFHILENTEMSNHIIFTYWITLKFQITLFSRFGSHECDAIFQFCIFHNAVALNKGSNHNLTYTSVMSMHLECILTTVSGGPLPDLMQSAPHRMQPYRPKAPRAHGPKAPAANVSRALQAQCTKGITGSMREWFCADLKSE